MAQTFVQFGGPRLAGKAPLIHPISWAHAAPYLLTALFAGYLLGSIPFGLLLTRLAGIGDIRRIGSGNIGATNVLRSGRRVLALLTLLLDAGKGTAAVLIAAGLYGPDIAVVAALGALLGHIFPVWLRFRGGKGVSTALGLALAFDWRVALLALGVWLAVVGLTRFSSLGALTATAAAPLLAGWLATPQVEEFLILVAVLVWLRHAANIRRLLTGAEPRIGQRAEAPSDAGGG